MKPLRYTTFALIFLLSACGGQSVKETLGLNKSSPDEFRVVSRPPLSVPPQFSLRPPGVSDASPTMIPADQQAKSTLTGIAPQSAAQENTFILQPGNESAVTTVKTIPSTTVASTPEAQFLRNAGADKADPNVRSNMIEEKIAVQEQQEESAWWDILSTTPEKKDPTVDAKKEADRIQKNEDEGKAVTEGDTPEVKGRDTGVLGRIFGY